MSISIPKDPNSFSTPELITTNHIDLDWTIDFSEKTISGSALLKLDIKDGTVENLILDSSQLSISKVICEDSGQTLNFVIGKCDPNFGSKVTISLPAGHDSKSVSIRVFYSTSPSSSGIQWLSPSQTSGKKHPFLFSQGEAIYARSYVPCQDTPQVKASYTATVKCKSCFIVLMSALRKDPVGSTEEKEMKCYKFHQPVPIPSYLIAIAVGDLVCEDIGPRSKVWAEREVVKKAAWEFAETEQMLSTAESICGEYVWQQYDLLVLPPSFPYGGMENPCLTFVTPTLLISVRPDNDPLTCLIPRLEGIEPDDAYSRVPYEKGHAFLWYLERLVGGPDEFEPFLKVYLKRFSLKSIDSECFKTFFLDYFGDNEETLKEIDWDAWFYTPGMPPLDIEFDSTLADECLKLCESWKKWNPVDSPASFSAKDLAAFSSNQIILWLSHMTEVELTLEKVKLMDEVYKLSEYNNAEIKFRWLRICVRAKWEQKLVDVFEFVNSLGRIKFTSPIYKDLYEWEDVREKTIANFLSQKDSMMSMSVQKLMKDLHLRE